MNWVLVSSDYFPSLGGIQSWVKALVDTSCQTYALSSDPTQVPPSPNLKVYKRSNFFIVRLLQIFFMMFFSKQSQFICFQTGSSAFAAFIVSLCMPWKKYWCVVHGNEILRPTHIWWKKIFFYCIFRRSRGVLCNSQFTKQLVQTHYSTRIKTYIWHPAVQNFYKSNHKDSKILFTCASFLPRKNQIKVIQALDYLPEYEYWIAGSGSEEELHELQKAAQGKNVKFFLNQSDVSELFQKAGVGILLSQNSISNCDVEGYGIFAVECLMAGIPTLVSDSGGLPETGAMVISIQASPQEIAEKIKNIKLTLPNANSIPVNAIKKLQLILGAP